MATHTTSFVSLFLLALLGLARANNYLIILPTIARSHYNVGFALAKGLASAGHQVTVVSPFPLKKPIKNINTVDVPGVEEIMKKHVNALLDSVKKSVLANMLNYYDMGLGITEVFLREPSVIQLRESNQTFDAVISEIFLNEAHFGLAEHFNAPLIGLGTFGAISWNTDLVGTPSPPSYVPHALLKFGDHMNLMERMINLGFLTFEQLFMSLYYLPRQKQLYNKYFPNNKQEFYDMRRNTSLVLLNQHVSLSFPRPYMPNMIEVGGMHINRQRQPLPTDLEEFINGATHGVIYFSMGSNLKSKNLPLEKRSEILKALRNLKQRVLWKFEEPNLPDKPPNVYISDWFPQDDILAHDKVLAFITHGGLLSTTESIYHGKPFVGIPIFGDQFLNMARAEQNGYGISVNYADLTADALQKAVESIINNPETTTNVRTMSARYKDQHETPLQRAVYWVEHVTRHKGAKYLRCAGQDLNFIQYHNLDAMFILYGGIASILIMIILLIRRLWRALLGFLLPQEKDNSIRRPKRD